MAEPTWTGFSVFALCSAGRDSSAGRFHPAAVALQLRFHAEVARAALGPRFQLRVALTDLASAVTRDVWRGLELPGVELALDPERASGRGYYTDVCFKIHAREGGGDWLELGDGGAVDWTAKLLSNAKERLVISGISSERICALAGAATS